MFRSAAGTETDSPTESGQSRFGSFVLKWRYWIIGFWLLSAGALNLLVPQLDSVVAERSAPFLPADTTSLSLVNETSPGFGEPATSGIAYLVLERDSGLDAADKSYYDAVVAMARADRDHVALVQDLWSSADTADSVVSKDGQAVYAQIRLTGDSGSPIASRAVAALRDSTDAVSKPAGLSVAITGISPTIVDEFDGVHRSLNIITGITVVLIAALLLAVYRSFVISAIPLMTIGLGLGVARPLVALLGIQGVPVSIFSMALLSALILGGGTDYAIFLISRFHEERNRGLSPRKAFLRSYHRVSTVIAASAAIVALTTATMSFTRVGIFRTIGLPCSVAIVVVACAALTLTPAVLSVAADRGLAEPKARAATDYWRSIATTAAHRPGRSLAGSLIVILLLAAVAPTLKLSYDERATQPGNTESNRGYDLIAEHYDGNELLPTLVIIQSDHDMRTAADFGAIEKISSAISLVPGVVSVRGITRPLGEPIPEASVGYQAGQVGDGLGAGLTELADAQPQIDSLVDGSSQYFDGVRQLADGSGQLVNGTEQALDGSAQLLDGNRQLDNGLVQLSAGAAQLSAGADLARAGAAELSAGVASATAPLEGPIGAVRSLQSMVAANPQCAQDQLCSAARDALGLFDSPIGDLQRLQDGAGQLADGNAQLASGADQLLAELQRAQAGSARLVDGQAALNSGLQRLEEGARQARSGSELLANASGPLAEGITQLSEGLSGLEQGLGQAVDYLTELKNNAGSSLNGGFYLPESAMADPRMKAAVQLYFSEDGRTARIQIVDSGDPFSPEGMERSRTVAETARQAVADTALANSRISPIGTSATWSDLSDMASRDLVLIFLAASLLIFAVLVLLLRSVVVPIYILVSVILSYLAALGLSTLVWQHVLGIPLHWAVPSMSFIALTAVGADYNLLLMSRVREELVDDPKSGTRTAVVRAVTGTGGVITVAAVVFAITMFALLSSSITNIGQIGFTIGTGILIDAMIVRTLMIPALASLLGRWNWWPRRVGREVVTSSS